MVLVLEGGAVVWFIDSGGKMYGTFAEDEFVLEVRSGGWLQGVTIFELLSLDGFGGTSGFGGLDKELWDL